MEQTFEIPARPWGEAEVKFLTANADLLDVDTRTELGLDQVVEETIIVTQEILDENPVLAEAGVQVGEVGVVTDEVSEGAMIEGGLPTNVDGGVVNNDTTDNA